MSGDAHLRFRATSRRGVIAAAGATLALPFFASLGPRRAHAQANKKPIRRLLYYYVPCGIHLPGWTPTEAGSGYGMTPLLKPLESLRADFSVVTGLANLPARPDGAGDHASGTGAFITCAHPYKTEGADIRNGISADQLAAKAIGAFTRFPSLQVGIDGGSNAGGCDSGYSCAYARNISWASETTPLPKLTNPATIFDRLFAGLDPKLTEAEKAKRQTYRKSLLDFATGEASRLQKQLGTTDRRKLDEYLTGVRELELRLTQAGDNETCQPIPKPGAVLPFAQHVRVMTDIMVLAFQCDMTRIISFMLGNGGSGQSYSFLGVPGGHHQLSHHQKNPANLNALEKIGTWEVEQLAYLLTRLKTIDDGGTDGLFNTSVFFSSEIADGDMHNHNNMPVLLAGHGGGAFKPGRHVVHDVARNERVSNLLAAMLKTVGVDAPIGDSTQPLTDL